MEEIAEEESNLSKKEEEILTDPIYGSSEESKKEVYGIIGNKDDSGDFYNSNESEPFYNSPEEDKKEKRFYF